MDIIKVNDEVLVFGRYEGLVLNIKDEQLLIYCPDFNIDEPYLVTHLSNVIILTHNTIIN